jgi:hypothetical protein
MEVNNGVNISISYIFLTRGNGSAGCHYVHQEE